MDQEVPIAEKALLTIREAADYYNLGLHKLRELTNDEHCPFVLWNGNKRLIKRKAFEEFLNSLYSVWITAPGSQKRPGCDYFGDPLGPL